MSVRKKKRDKRPSHPRYQPSHPICPATRTIQITMAAPDTYFRASEQPGTAELVEYEPKDYTDPMAATTKPAYVYLPYGYDGTEKNIN